MKKSVDPVRWLGIITLELKISPKGEEGCIYDQFEAYITSEF